MKALGIRSVALLTGDRRSAAEALASGITEIDEVHADLLPADKAHWIEREVAAGRRVAMIGDGVNDAPALAAATVGLALGRIGSDLAAEAGDVILMGDPLLPLPGLLRLSRQMVRIIQQGINVFAFGVNGLGVVLCAWGVLNPVGGALFHELASLAVMLNSLRLLWFERWDQTALGRFAGGILNVAEWLSDSLSPTQVIQGLVARRRVVVRLAIAAACAWYLTSNCVVLTEDEQALVTRFGRYETTLGAGLHQRLARATRTYPSRTGRPVACAANRIQVGRWGRRRAGDVRQAGRMAGGTCRARLSVRSGRIVAVGRR